MKRLVCDKCFVLSFVCFVWLNFATARAETFDQGGSPERFKGEGDNVPPRCLLDLPTAATAPFFVKWNCADNDDFYGDIQSQLWILRDGDATPQLLKEFLGFPAAVFIDNGVLKVEDFQDGLPVNFRLVARDRAGNATMSPFRAVLPQASALSRCTLDIATTATDSTGDTTGTPAMTVSLETSSITSSEIGDDGILVATVSAQSASPCEISSVCENDSKVTFSASLTIESDNTASGSLSASPGSVVLDVNGTAEKSDAMVTTIDVSGETTIEGQAATVSLECVE